MVSLLPSQAADGHPLALNCTTTAFSSSRCGCASSALNGCFTGAPVPLRQSERSDRSSVAGGTRCVEREKAVEYSARTLSDVRHKKEQKEPALGILKLPGSRKWIQLLGVCTMRTTVPDRVPGRDPTLSRHGRARNSFERRMLGTGNIVR